METPLTDVVVLEFAGLGPAPFGTMLLSDYGARIIRIDRLEPTVEFDQMRGLSRGRSSVGIDLRTELGRDIALELVKMADVLIDPYRPGVMERLGLGPDICTDLSPRLVYARMTGWGQTGSLSARAGHDLNYLAIAGALHPMGRAAQPPPPPLNLIGDFGGGGVYLALGVLVALLERERSGVGQVVDIAMVDGVRSLMTMFHAFVNQGLWSLDRESNLLDGGAPFYDTYETRDARFVAVAAVEPKFFHNLLMRLEIDPTAWRQMDRTQWPALRDALAAAFAQRTRDYWSDLFSDVDACVSPVLNLAEAPSHPSALERDSYDESCGYPEPATAPRFSRTPARKGTPPPDRGVDTDAVLSNIGLRPQQIAQLRAQGIVG